MRVGSPNEKVAAWCGDSRSTIQSASGVIRIKFQEPMIRYSHYVKIVSSSIITIYFLNSHLGLKYPRVFQNLLRIVLFQGEFALFFWLVITML